MKCIGSTHSCNIHENMSAQIMESAVVFLLAKPIVVLLNDMLIRLFLFGRSFSAIDFERPGQSRKHCHMTFVFCKCFTKFFLVWPPCHTTKSTKNLSHECLTIIKHFI